MSSAEVHRDPVTAFFRERASQARPAEVLGVQPGAARPSRLRMDPAWRSHDLRSGYDVVIIGGGVHGLATASYLATNHGITDGAIVDKGYLGGQG